MASLDDILTTQKNGVVAINGIQRLMADFLTLIQPALGGALKVKYTPISGTYTVTANDCVVDCTANTFTVTLPTAIGLQGQIFTVKNSGAGVITVAAAGGEFIDGAASQILSVQYQSISLVSTNTGWRII
tara:strand:+ start:10467 stop:10856 length:390 start_codon:yes stop_codon:yes gene_type:complete